MAKHGRGLICLALNKKQVEKLSLPLMSAVNKARMQTAFTVSIEARIGITTGISAFDRAKTIKTAINRNVKKNDIVSPGHVFPLVARSGGVLERAGHTEASVDISKLAKMNPSSVICEVMNEDGRMARLDDLLKFAKKHSLKIASIDANNFHFCEFIAKKKRPTIISTGMLTYSEILQTQKIFKKYKTPHIFLHCTSAYPSNEKDKNLNCIPKLRSLLNEDVGFSGHGVGIAGAAGAAALGAKVIEKHVTLNKKMLGPDHSASLEFATFKHMADTCRKVVISLGSSEKKFLKSEKVLHSILCRKFVVRKDIKKGAKFNKDNIKTALTYKKGGLLPNQYYKILNKKVKRSLTAGQILKVSDI
jgi:3,4-dihydroxy-2-butanone 4-phosphate synthase